MTDGTVVATGIVVFREALEAGLIVGIVLTVIARMRAMRYAPYIWASIAAALVVSGFAGWALSVATESVQGQWEKIIEGCISLPSDRCKDHDETALWSNHQHRIGCRSNWQPRSGKLCGFKSRYDWS